MSIAPPEEIDYLFKLRYFNWIKGLQRASGLWPYSSWRCKTSIKAFINSMLFIVLIPLCNGFRVWCGKSFNNICGENILGILITIVIFSKHTCMAISEKNLISVYKRIARAWLSITSPEEKSIMEKYAELSRMYTIGYFVYITSAGICFSQIPVLPFILDVILPLNESRPKILFVQGEFIIDPYEYFSVIYAVMMGATMAAVLTIITVDSTYCVIIYQIIGITSVIKHRLNIASRLENQKNNNSYKTIISAIRLHQESISIVNLIDISYCAGFLVIVFITTIFISTGVFITVISIQTELNFCDLLRFLPIEFGSILHVLCISFIAQKIIDCSCDLLTDIYSIEWYGFSKESKNLIKFMMLRTSQPNFLTAGGFYIMSVFNFGNIMKTAMSYTTVLLSFK